MTIENKWITTHQVAGHGEEHPDKAEYGFITLPALLLSIRVGVVFACLWAIARIGGVL